MKLLRCCLSWVALGVFAQAAAPMERTRARLLLEAESAPPGATVMAAVELTMPPAWHTYWRFPGESGIPTAIEWTLPRGVSAGDIQWPMPEKALFGGLTTFEFAGTALLLVPLSLAADAPAGEVELAATVSWLECEAQGVCIPGGGKINARFSIGPNQQPSKDAAAIAEALKKLPVSAAGLGPLATWERPATDDTRPLLIEWTAADKLKSIDFYPYGSDKFEVLPAVDALSLGGGKARLRKPVKRSDGGWPAEIRGLIVQKLAGNEPPQSFEATLKIQDADGSKARGSGGGVAGAGAGSESDWSVSAPPSLAKMLWFAFVGGMILNIMPCVFPVIALKILGFVNQGKEDPRRVFKLGVIYSLGVVASFLVMAGMVIAVQQTGKAASWGMQMQNPQFTLVLTVLMTLVALNLFGLFEVTASGAVGAAGQLAHREGASGAFFNGVLAVVLATPCTAPFLAPALGFAFAQPPALIVVFFAAVGLGLALPYLVLSAQPKWIRVLPRPGAWMEKFKIAMGFPMLMTALWLFSFTARRFGSDGTLWLGLFLVVLALAAWIFGEFVQRGTKRRGFAAILCVLLIGGGYAKALEDELHWRNPVKNSSGGGGAEASNSGDPDKLAWGKWSPEAVAQARAERRVILVDFTADWCLTCKANLRTSIEISSTRKKLKELNAVTLIGDNTDEDPAIIAELKKFGRAGVPLVLVYPKDAARPPLVLPAFLTPGMMHDALDQAAK